MLISFHFKPLLTMHLRTFSKFKPLLNFLNFQLTWKKCYTSANKLTVSYSFMPGDTVLSHSTLGQLVDKSSSEAGDDISFIVPHQGIMKSFSEFGDDVNKLASGLIALGLCKGDRIGLCAPNIYEWPVTQFAAAKAGLILVNINHAYQTDELKYCLNKVQCKALITSESFKTQNFYEMLCSFLPELPGSKPGSLQAANLKNLQSVVLISDHAKSGTITFNEVLKAGDSKTDGLLHTIEKQIQFDDPVNIQFTSGTTGRPKGATLSHHNIVNNAFVSGKRLGFMSHKPILCCQVPLYHCFGCVGATLSSVLFQYTCVLPSPSFDAEASIRSIENERCTAIYGTPTMFVDILHRSKSDTKSSSLKQAIIGGAACPEDVVHELKKRFNLPHIHIAYGSTESSPGVSMNFLDDTVSTVALSYIPNLEFVELKIVDDNCQILPIGMNGEICSRGHVSFIGYWDEKEKTNEVVDQHNWYHTGDLGHMNENGYIKVIGRKKDMVIRGGENLYPLEIENFLHTHPSILEAHVCGVPDARLGEELCAWVKLKSEAQMSKQDLKNYCKGKMAHFKIPRYVLFVEDFPKTVSGKIQKFKMSKESMKLLNL